MDTSRNNYSSQVTSQSPSPVATPATTASTSLLPPLVPPSTVSNPMITAWHDYHDAGNSAYDSSGNFHWHSSAMMTLEPPLPPLLPPVPIHETSTIHEPVSNLNAIHHQHSSSSPSTAGGAIIDYQSGHNLSVATPSHHQLTNLDSSVHSSYLPLAPHQIHSSTPPYHAPTANFTTPNQGHSGSPLVHHMLTGSYHSSPTPIIGQAGNFIESHNSSLDLINTGNGLSEQVPSNHLLMTADHHGTSLTGSSEGPIITELGSATSRPDGQVISGTTGTETGLPDVTTDGAVDRSSNSER